MKIGNIEVAVDRVASRAYEIADRGCPYCGSTAFDLVDTSPEEGLNFLCQDSRCPTNGRHIPFKEADQVCLSPANAEKMRHLNSLNSRIDVLKVNLLVEKTKIRKYKALHGKDTNALLKRCNAAYERVRKAKVFPYGHDPAFREDYFVNDPDTGDPLFYGTINARRKAKTRLSARLFNARERAAVFANTLHYYRTVLRDIREEKSNLEKKRDAILSDAILSKELALRGTTHKRD